MTLVCFICLHMSDCAGLSWNETSHTWGTFLSLCPRASSCTHVTSFQTKQNNQMCDSFHLALP